MSPDKKMIAASKPIFSIGVTTYNRKDLLKQTLLSILGQSFTDFEVIVGNDFVDETLSLEMMGIDDPRVIIINHERNLGELENMNSLLSVASGKYFTWQFDDDPCAPIFLSAAYSALKKFDFPLSVFTSYLGIYGTHVHKFTKDNNVQSRLFTGRDFLRACLSGRLKALGCCGFYDIDYLRNIGGVQRLSNGPIALHSEYLLLIRSGLLSEVAYVDAPLVSTRMHDNSWTCSNSDVELFKQAGINLIRESVVILSNDSLKDDFSENLSSVLKSVISAVVVKTVMCNKQLDVQEITRYRSLIEAEFNPLRGTPLYDCAVSNLDTTFNYIPLYISKARLKMLMPFKYLKYVHMVLSLFSRYTNKAF
jgi:glycosyltransferase involved in cell wall biosynthesis